VDGPGVGLLVGGNRAGRVVSISGARLGWLLGLDPVENAALLPWLTRRPIFTRSSCRTAVDSFASEPLARDRDVRLHGARTFFTRSGVLQSVHSFSSSTLGPALITFFRDHRGYGVALVAWRGDEYVHPSGSIIRRRARDSSWRTTSCSWASPSSCCSDRVSPAYEAVNGTQVTVGSPYFAAVAAAGRGGTVVLDGHRSGGQLANGGRRRALAAREDLGVGGAGECGGARGLSRTPLVGVGGGLLVGGRRRGGTAHLEGRGPERASSRRLGVGVARPPVPGDDRAPGIVVLAVGSWCDLVHDTLGGHVGEEPTDGGWTGSTSPSGGFAAVATSLEKQTQTKG